MSRRRLAFPIGQTADGKPLLAPAQGHCSGIHKGLRGWAHPLGQTVDGKPLLGWSRSWGRENQPYFFQKGERHFAVPLSASDQARPILGSWNERCQQEEEYSGSSSDGVEATSRQPTPNPGCCPDIFSCDSGYKTRIDISFQVNGCPSDCNTGTGWAEYYNFPDGMCPEGSSMSDNYMEGGEGCVEWALYPDCEGGTPEASNALGGVYASNGNSLTGSACGPFCSPYTICPDEIVDDACYAHAAFTCFSFDNDCVPRWVFCGSFQFRQGMTYTNWTHPTVPPECSWEGLNIVPEAYLDGVFNADLTALALAQVPGGTFVNCMPYIVQVPFYSCDFKREVQDFDVASCDPAMFVVSGVPPTNVTMRNGIRGTGLIEVIPGTPCKYRYHYETVPLQVCSPTMDATATAECVACEGE